jgi:hypothetical protein
VACVGVVRKVYRVLVGKPEGKRRLGRPRRRWEGGLRLAGGVDRIQLDLDRGWWRAVVNAVMNLRFLAPRSWY